MEVYRILADLVDWFHCFWIILLMGGMVLSDKYEWYKPYHLVVLAITVISQIIFMGCPLVTLENALRAQYDPKTTYTGSFICHYLETRFGFQLPPEYITLALAGIVLLSAFIILRQPKKKVG